mmetsp:Transcript_35844/g.80575  ORF Transcript_35844/g.80575 Transcript_35844/m.80575 type:complete len:207 (-) Transcript_35844:141-761(-)
MPAPSAAADDGGDDEGLDDGPCLPALACPPRNLGGTEPGRPGPLPACCRSAAAAPLIRLSPSCLATSNAALVPHILIPLRNCRYDSVHSAADLRSAVHSRSPGRTARATRRAAVWTSDVPSTWDWTRPTPRRSRPVMTTPSRLPDATHRRSIESSAVCSDGRGRKRDANATRSERRRPSSSRTGACPPPPGEPDPTPRRNDRMARR